jgi:hypothetical protein
VAAWVEGGSASIVRLTATGAPMGAVEMLPSGDVAGASDFFAYADGGVGWLSGSRLARLRACR